MAGVLVQSAPQMNLDDACAVAAEAYGWRVTAEWLSGERDQNILLRLADGRCQVLKFINAAETAAETDVQIKVLEWLAGRECAVVVPQAQYALDGRSVVDYRRDGQPAVRVRAYSYLQGAPTASVAMTPALQTSFGQTAARLVQALDGFDHPALQRVLLWDVMHVGQLMPWAQALPEDNIKTLALAFLPQFEHTVLPQLRALPQQVIHGDISRSNTVVDSQRPQQLAGVLDFGDLSRGPRVLELAIAASYAMDEADALPSLARIVAGYESLLPLSAAERQLLPYAVVARCLQRIVISEWRSAQFPHNRSYLMRSNAPARALLQQVLPHWRGLGCGLENWPADHA